MNVLNRAFALGGSLLMVVLAGCAQLDQLALDGQDDLAMTGLQLQHPSQYVSDPGLRMVWYDNHEAYHYPFFLKQTSPRVITATGLWEDGENLCSLTWAEAFQVESGSGTLPNVRRQGVPSSNGECVFDFAGTDESLKFVLFVVENYWTYPCDFVNNACKPPQAAGNLRASPSGNNVEFMPVASGGYPPSPPTPPNPTNGSASFTIYNPSSQVAFSGSWAGSTISLFGAGYKCSTLALKVRSDNIPTVDVRGYVHGSDCAFSQSVISGQRDIITFAEDGVAAWYKFSTFSGCAKQVEKFHWLKLGC